MPENTKPAIVVKPETPVGSGFVTVTSRPAPVVPLASAPTPAFGSRSASPRRNDLPSTSPGELSVPGKASRPIRGNLSRSSSIADVHHIFERDVEFSSAHALSASEAVDVAIAPVLDSAILVFTQPGSELSQEDVANIAREHEDGGGWTEGIALSPDSTGTGHASTSRSPVRDHRASRASSRTRMASLPRAPNIAIPNVSLGAGEKSPTFTSRLTDALEREQEKGHGKLRTPKTSFSRICGTMTPRSFAMQTMPDLSPVSSIKSGVYPESLVADPKRLSFISMADLINDERLTEMTGSQFEEEGPLINSGEDVFAMSRGRCGFEDGMERLALS